MPLKRTSTSTAPAMNQAAIWQLIDDCVAAALEAQAANMENTDNTNKNPEQAPVARKCSYKEFMSCQPFNFKDSEKIMEAFIKGLPRSIEGNVTASKPQTLEEAINIAQRLMDQVTKHNSMQGTNDHKRKFDDRRNTTDDSNYHHNHNNDHHQQQNRRQETLRAYAPTPTKNHGYVGPHPLYINDSLYNENIEYVEASPHDSELVSLEAAEIVISKVEEIEDDNLREKLLDVHLLIANIEALKDNPTL
nr:reverse transcriptase domain-containing protein [Tanacetum cinerariifolium]